MADTFYLRFLAADKPFYEGLCNSLTIPITDGEQGILPHHCNMIAAVVPGVMRMKTPDAPLQTAAVSGGLVKIEGNEVLLLLDTVERPDEIDVNRAMRAEAHAQEVLQKKMGTQEHRAAQLNLARAINRVKVSRTHSK